MCPPWAQWTVLIITIIPDDYPDDYHHNHGHHNHPGDDYRICIVNVWARRGGHEARAGGVWRAACRRTGPVNLLVGQPAEPELVDRPERALVPDVERIVVHLQQQTAGSRGRKQLCGRRRDAGGGGQQLLGTARTPKKGKAAGRGGPAHVGVPEVLVLLGQPCAGGGDRVALLLGAQGKGSVLVCEGTVFLAVKAVEAQGKGSVLACSKPSRWEVKALYMCQYCCSAAASSAASALSSICLASHSSFSCRITAAARRSSERVQTRRGGGPSPTVLMALSCLRRICSSLASRAQAASATLVSSSSPPSASMAATWLSYIWHSSCKAATMAWTDLIDPAMCHESGKNTGDGTGSHDS